MKEFIYHDQVGFVLGMKVDLIFTNILMYTILPYQQTKKKSHMIMLMGSEKRICQNPTFHDKNSQQTET